MCLLITPQITASLVRLKTLSICILLTSVSMIQLLRCKWCLLITNVIHDNALSVFIFWVQFVNLLNVVTGQLATTKSFKYEYRLLKITFKATFGVFYISGVKDKTCWTVNYVSRRICALEAFSVNISSEYSHPENQQPDAKSWYKKIGGGTQGEKLTGDDIEYHDNKNHHILTLNNLQKNHSAEYFFRLQENNTCQWSELPGVTLVVTGNNKKREV